MDIGAGADRPKNTQKYTRRTLTVHARRAHRDSAGPQRTHARSVSSLDPSLTGVWRFGSPTGTGTEAEDSRKKEKKGGSHGTGGERRRCDADAA